MEQQESTKELQIRKVTMKDFPNYTKLLIVTNIPRDVPESEIEAFFYTIIAGSKIQSDTKQYPINNVRRLENLGIVSLEFRKKQDSEIVLMMDDIREFNSSFRANMRIFRVRRFIQFWND